MHALTRWGLLVRAVGFTALFISKLGKSHEMPLINVLPKKVLSWKNGKAKSGERDTTPAKGNYGFYCRSPKIKRLPKPWQTM